jgi:replicative DNA helicase
VNSETRLLSRAISDKSLVKLYQRGVNETWFSDDDDKRLWIFLRDHHGKYGQMPSLEIVLENFPTYKILNVEDPLDFLLDDLIKRRRKTATSLMMHEAITKIEQDHDHEAALNALRAGLVKLEQDASSAATDVDITNVPMQRWDDYLELKSLPNGLRGYPTGFETIDKATSGLQRGQLITIVATPKTGKSTLALQIAHNIHLRGVVPLFQSFEMLNHEQISRYDSMRARISHHRLTTGSLTPDEEARYHTKLRNLEKMQTKFWFSESSTASTISGIDAKLELHTPDVLFIDGVYLMIDEMTGKMNESIALTNITRSLKKLAQKYQIPIVITTQVLSWKLKGGKLNTDGIGYSSSFVQDSDVIFGLHREDEDVDDTRVLKILASRNCGPGEVSMLWDWETGHFREMDESDL